MWPPWSDRRAGSVRRPEHGGNERRARSLTVPACLPPFQDQIADRDDHAREQHVGRQAADDHDRQRLLHLRPGPDAQGQREQPEDRRQARHQDRPEPRAARPGAGRGRSSMPSARSCWMYSTSRMPFFMSRPISRIAPM